MLEELESLEELLLPDTPCTLITKSEKFVRYNEVPDPDFPFPYTWSTLERSTSAFSWCCVEKEFCLYRFMLIQTKISEPNLQAIYLMFLVEKANLRLSRKPRNMMF